MLSRNHVHDVEAPQPLSREDVGLMLLRYRTTGHSILRAEMLRIEGRQPFNGLIHIVGDIVHIVMACTSTTKNTSQWPVKG